MMGKKVVLKKFVKAAVVVSELDAGYLIRPSTLIEFVLTSLSLQVSSMVVVLLGDSRLYVT